MGRQSEVEPGFYAKAVESYERWLNEKCRGKYGGTIFEVCARKAMVEVLPHCFDQETIDFYNSVDLAPLDWDVDYGQRIRNEM